MRGRVTLGLKGHGRGRSCSSQPSAGAAPGGAVGQPESECAGCPPANEDTVGSGEEGGAAVVRMTLSQMRVAKIKAERAKMAAQKVAAARRRREEPGLRRYFSASCFNLPASTGLRPMWLISASVMCPRSAKFSTPRDLSLSAAPVSPALARVELRGEKGCAK